MIRRRHFTQATGFLARRFHALHPYEVQAIFTVYLNERKAVFGLRPAALMEVVRRG